MKTECAAGEVCQDRVAARLAAAGFPAALKLQVGERVSGGVRLLPDSAGKSGDQFRIRAIAKLADRLALSFGKFEPHVHLPEKGEREREHDNVRFLLGGCVVAPERQSKTIPVRRD